MYGFNNPGSIQFSLRAPLIHNRRLLMTRPLLQQKRHPRVWYKTKGVFSLLYSMVLFGISSATVSTYCHRNIGENVPIFFLLFTYKSAWLVLVRHLCKYGYPYSRTTPLNFQGLRQWANLTSRALRSLPQWRGECLTRRKIRLHSCCMKYSPKYPTQQKIIHPKTQIKFGDKRDPKTSWCRGK